MHPVEILARYWPFANGSGRFVDKFGKGLDLGSGERLARTSDGFPLTVFADEHIGRHILLSGKFDRSIVQTLLDRARPGDVLVDIGANIGYVSACFLSNVENGTVVCVEPQPGVVDLLRSNMKQFDGRAKICQVAISDTDGELRFHVNSQNRGASKVAADGELRVPSISALNFFGSMDRIDLLKIDVEGHELPIFTALESELPRLKPRAILFEEQVGLVAPDKVIGRILKSCGYATYGIDKRLLKTHLLPISSAADCQFNDYLAVLT